MGQGAPETGPLPGAPPRDFHMSIEDALLEYAPVTVRFFSTDCSVILSWLMIAASFVTVFNSITTSSPLFYSLVNLRY